MLSLNPANCDPRQVYKLMTGMIVPRPVALVSTVDRNGVPNLAPFSFFSGVGSFRPQCSSAPWSVPLCIHLSTSERIPFATSRRQASSL